MFKKVSGKRVLSILLAVFIVFASVPVAMAEYVEYAQYTVTGDDAKTYQYYSDGSQFRRYGSSDNAFMNVWVDNHYRFILKEETQKFYFVQNLRLQHQYELFQSKSTYFDKIGLYTGQALTGTPDVQPTEAQKEATNELIENYNLQEAFWTADNDNAQEKVELAGAAYVEGTIPSQYELHANAVSGGNKNYYWDGLSSFETSVGFQKTFYNVLSWYLNVDAKNSGVPTNYIVYGITLDVTDIRTLVAEVEKIKGILNNPAGYSAEQIEQYEKYIAAIPEGMVEGTTYYTQAQVDAVYNYITAAEDLADTEEYMYYRQKAFELISKDTNGNYNHSDAYTAESLAEFEAAFKAVDIGEQLPYPVSRQSEVDEATIAVKGTFSELVGANRQTHTSNGTTSDTVWETTDGIDVPSGDTANDHTVFKLSNTSYKFIQVTDDQKFSFAQELTGRAKNVSYNILGAVRPNFESFTFDAVCDGTNCVFDEASPVSNNTTDFMSRLDSSAKSTTNDVTSFTGWQYNSRSGNTVHGFTITNGILQQTLLTSDTKFAGSTTYHDFYGDATISFKGNSKETDVNGNRVVKDSEIDTSFYWKLTSSYDGTFYHAHIPVEILITDARALVDIYNELHGFVNYTKNAGERELYTPESINGVSAALSAVPQDMINGTAYYTQEEVNAQYNALLTAKNELETKAKADYTELDNAILEANRILNDGKVYTNSTRTALEEALSEANLVERELPEASQQIVTAAAEKLQNALETIKEKADYSEYDAVKEQLDAIITAGNDGSYSDTAWNEFVDSVTAINEALDRDLSVDDQAVIDEAKAELETAKSILEQNEKADYTGLNEAKNRAEEILSDGNVYTDSTRTALETALENANAVDEGLLAGSQQTIDELEAALEEAISKIALKADYTELNNEIELAEGVLADGNVYTNSTKTALEEALAEAKAVDKDLPQTEQTQIEAALTKLRDARTAIKEKADYSEYDAVKEQLDAIITAGNDGSYSDTAWNEFVDSITAINEALDRDLSVDDQAVIDVTKQELEMLEAEILSKEYADYTGLNEAKNRAEEILSDGNVYTDSTRTALETALENANAVDEGLLVGSQQTIDELEAALEEAISKIALKADYTELNNEIELAEGVLADGNVYTNSTKTALEEALAEAKAVEKDLPQTEQTQIEAALTKLRDARTAIKEKADYSELENALLKAESILNDTEKVYTDGSKNELQSIYDKATALDKNLLASEQSKIEEVLSELNGAIDGIKEKADYSALDEAIEKAKDELNRTDIKYTANTEQILRDALTVAENVTRDLSTDDQHIINDAIDSLENATSNLIEAADTTAYEDAVKDAEEIIAEGNSQGRYDEEDWNKFIESVTNAKDTVGSNIGNIPKTEQDKVNTATDTIKNSTEEIYNKRYIFVEFRDEFNGLYKSYRIQYSESLTFESLTEIPEIPEATGFKKYIGWYYKNNTIMNLTDAITEDVTVFCYEEEIKLVAKAESGATIDETNDFFKGLKHGTTVDALLNSLDNNTAFIVVKDINGNIVDNSQLIATGMTIELVSRENNLVVNEKVTVVVRGDITGDGLVNDDDYEKSRGMCLKTTEYGENEKAFFAANDTDGDGVLDVIDLFNISNMRYGN